MLPVPLRLILLLAVLVQYTPVPLCAVEQATLGSNCHDWSAASVSGSHSDVQVCGGGDAGSDQRCICEQPKVVGEQQPVAHIAVDLATQSVVLGVLEEPVVVEFVPTQVADPPRNLLSALQLPLLI